MSCLNEQVWFNKDEKAAIMRGLNVIVNGFARLKMGGVYAPEVLYANIAHKFSKRLFDEGIYERTLNLRNCLKSNTTASRAHFRLDFLDFSLAAFAIRLVRGRLPECSPKGLQRKLEVYRKRRKRAVQKNLGSDEYQALQRRWTGYQQYIRYHIVPMRKAVRVATFRNHHKDQLMKLMTLAESVIEERCTEPVAPEELSRIVRRFKDDARRGRKGLKLRELLAEPERTKQMLFEILRKRMTLQLKPEFQSLAERSSARAQKFNSALVIEDEAGNNVPARPADLTLKVITSEKVVESLANFFIKEVHRDDWARVNEQAEFLSSRHSMFPKHQPVESFEELIQQWEPPINSDEIFEDINKAALWLISCLTLIEARPLDIIRLVNGGFVAALNH